jgi:hypothetical protein
MIRPSCCCCKTIPTEAAAALNEQLSRLLQLFFFSLAEREREREKKRERERERIFIQLVTKDSLNEHRQGAVWSVSQQRK